MTIQEKAKKKAKELKLKVRAVFLLWKDPATPLIARIVAACTVIYALSPIDLVPDFIPVLGYLDDLVILPALIALTIKLIPNELWEHSIQLAKETQERKPEKKWFYALPIVVCWGLLLFVIWRFWIASRH